MAEREHEIKHLAEIFSTPPRFSGRSVRLTAKALDTASGTVWLFVLATYKFSANTQDSYGIAWTTGADGVTPQNVESLCVQIEVAGQVYPSDPFCNRNTNRTAFVTRNAFDSPQRVIARAVSEGPHIEAEDTSDD